MLNKDGFKETKIMVLKLLSQAVSLKEGSFLMTVYKRSFFFNDSYMKNLKLSCFFFIFNDNSIKKKKKPSSLQYASPNFDDYFNKNHPLMLSIDDSS